MTKILARALFLWLILLGAHPAQGQVSRTVHNLSAAGGGGAKPLAMDEVCTFCHTPHSMGTARAIWDRNAPPTIYTLYSSSTLEAKLNQPTGASRVCLSCHDGTTAPGNLRAAGAALKAFQTPLQGRISLGTDLSDDHPISFVYDNQLALKRGDLADPVALSRALPLDRTNQLQCTTCHDPHNDRYRKFLRMDDQRGALCAACHRLRNWSGSSHATSQAAWRGGLTNPFSQKPYASVSANGCNSCHRPHSAPRPPFLLDNAQERAVCLVCHNGSVAAKGLEAEFSKFSAHSIASREWIHEPREDPKTMQRHVSCTDCHNPHQAVSTPASAPFVSGMLRGVRGVNISGQTVAESAFEYEVCLKCHGIQAETGPGKPIRQDNIRNIRLQINAGNPSYHPVAAAGKNSSMGGFEIGFSAAAIISCTDCHNNSEWTPGGTQPRGPHGSRFSPILEREYQMDGPSEESFQAYALCYKCHNRSFLIGDQARTFQHQRHLTAAKAPCAVCHDAHGSRRSTGLINFMLRDRTGSEVVKPSLRQGRIEHVILGRGRGQCFLMCHGKNHEPASYP